MSARFFLDTNIFVYTFDSEAPGKRERARDLVQIALTDGVGVISYQVVQEFLNVALRKFAVPLTARDADTYLDTVLMPLCEVFPDRQLYASAIVLHSRTGWSFYDSLIVSAARRAGVTVLYSEDLQSGRILDGLTVVNPFA
jgi:predicted nucleic acid-binding protein